MRRDSEHLLSIRAPDGVNIPVIRRLPSGEPKHGVLLLHGLTTNKNEHGNFFSRLSAFLASDGMASARIDFRGHGDSATPSREFSITSQVLDTITAANWFAATLGIPHISIMACSFGAAAALFCAKKEEELIDSVSLLCPVLDYEHTLLKPRTPWAREVFSQAAQEKAFSNGALLIAEEFECDVKLIVEMAIIKPALVLDQLEQRCLIIHGSADSMVPVEVSRSAAQQTPRIRYVEIPRMDHGIDDVDDHDGTSDATQRNFNTVAKLICEHIRGMD